MSSVSALSAGTWPARVKIAVQNCRAHLERLGKFSKTTPSIDPKVGLKKEELLHWAMISLLEGTLVGNQVTLSQNGVNFKWVFGSKGIFRDRHEYLSALASYIENYDLPEDDRGIVAARLRKHLGAYGGKEASSEDHSGEGPALRPPPIGLSANFEASPAFQRLKPAKRAEAMLQSYETISEYRSDLRVAVIDVLGNRLLLKRVYDLSDEALLEIRRAITKVLRKYEIAEGDFVPKGEVYSGSIVQVGGIFESENDLMDALEERVIESKKITGDLRADLRAIIKDARSKL